MAVPYAANAYQPEPRVRFEWIGESWQLFLANAGIWIAAQVVQGLVVFGVYVALLAAFGVLPALAAALGRGSAANLYSMPGYWVAQGFNYLVQPFFLAGLLRMANAQIRRESISVGMLFSGGKYYLPVLGFIVIYGVAIAAGTFLLVIPGLIAVALLAPAMALVADGVPVGEAISRSVAAVKLDLLTACLFALALGLLTAVGTVLTCGLGTIALSPMILLVLSLIYRDMIGMPIAAPTNPYAAGYGGAQAAGVWPPAPGPQQQPLPPAAQPYGAPPYGDQPLAGAPPPPPPYNPQPLAGAPPAQPDSSVWPPVQPPGEPQASQLPPPSSLFYEAEPNAPGGMNPGGSETDRGDEFGAPPPRPGI